MVLSLFTVALMLICAVAYFREGLFTAVCMCANVLLAGLIAFNFFEPLAGGLEAVLGRSFLGGCEEFVSLILAFSISLGFLRTLTNNFNNEVIEFQPTVNALGGAAVAAIMGYLLSGILICAMETLPWHQNFLGFEPYREGEPVLRRVLPPDRVWLAMMHRAGMTCLSRGDTPTFDADGTFESDYFHLRRYGD